MYSNVHTFNLSDLGLTSLQMDSCAHARNLVKFNASINKITELPKNLLLNCKSLTEIDLSFNQIKKIDPDAFPADNQLELLNLCSNNINELAVQSFQNLVEIKQLLLTNNQIVEIPTFLFHTMKHLESLDFSFNKITKINAFAFSGDFELLKLNLSHNKLTALEWKIFKNGNLKNLEHLDASFNLISEIKPGTFSSMVNLQSLNLAHNKMKSLKANILPSRARYLKSLSISQNQLQELIGFTNIRIPNAKILGISEFNCSYFNRLFQSITWKHVDVIPKLIECNTVNEGTDFNDYNEATESDDREEGAEIKKGHSTERSGSGLLVSTWINAVCLMIIVIGLAWFVLHKRFPKKSFSSRVLYRPTNDESLNAIENNGYDVFNKKGKPIEGREEDSVGETTSDISDLIS